MKPIVRNIQNNDAYEYLGENKYKNLRTGKSGEVDEETARKIFKVNLELTTMINEFPYLETAIQKLNLKINKSC